MCGRFSNRYSLQDLHELYRAYINEAPWNPLFNIPPTAQIPVIIREGGQRRVKFMRWGLIPAWAKEMPKFSTFNARADGLTDKPTFRDAWKSGRRCIIPASSFFEWRQHDKKPFAIGLSNRGPMAFGGLWEEWKPKDGPPVLSCTIITTTANALMADIHLRMPVILSEEGWAAWLNEEPASEQQLLDMMRPFPAERLAAWPVSKAVGNVRNEGPDLLEPERDLLGQ